MTGRYVAYGKHVQRDGKPFADAVSEDAARTIVNALNDRAKLIGSGA